MRPLEERERWVCRPEDALCGQACTQAYLGAGMARAGCWKSARFYTGHTPLGYTALGYKVPRPSASSAEPLVFPVSTKVNKTILLTLEELQVSRGWQVTKLTITTGCDAIMEATQSWSAGTGI